MALQSTLFRFQIELSDIDRNLYKPFDLRLAQHPSESPLFLISRLFAFLLNFEPGLEFSPQGLNDPDQPAISQADPRGGYLTWIEIGNPSAKRLHLATKSARRVKVYTYKDPKQWLLDMQAADIFHFEQIEFFAFDSIFLQKIAARIEKTNTWSLIHNDGVLTLNFKDESIESPIMVLRSKVD